jgi:ferredoxin
MIVMERDVQTGHAAPMIYPIGCDLCGGDPACAKACQYEAITYERDTKGFKILVHL